MDNFIIHGFVDVTGSSNIKTIKAMFDVVSTSDIVMPLYQKDYNNKEIPTEEIIIPEATTGIIQDGDNNPLEGVKVSFIRDYVVSDANVRQRNGFQTVIDYSITDMNGKYTVFVEPGIYTIRIDGGQLPQIFNGQEIVSNFKQYYYCVKKGVIRKKYNDVIEFYGTDKKQIFGQILDQNKKPIENAEILITEGSIIKTYIKTDSNGKYAFAIENGIYDVRIRASNKPVKYIKDFNFEDGKGFMTILRDEKSILFGRDKQIWI
jgi:hypothetical protein